MTVAAVSPGAVAGSGRAERPLVGVAAVLIGAIISTLNSRITTFGLADINGALGFSFDAGSWVSTVFFASQMLVTPAAAWASTILGTRRLLTWATLVFALSSLLPPLTHDYATVIALQFVRGLAVGVFIPAALGFILRSLTPRWWIWGIAAYAFRFVFSQNIGGALEGWYSEYGAWQWIFWENAVMTPVMTLLVWFGMPQRPIDRVLLRQTDWSGIAFSGIGFALIYAGLDQGNRLDWFNSGLINGLFAGGAVLIAAFIVNEARVPHPLIHLPVLIRRSVWIPAVLIGIFGFGVTATAFVLPNYLIQVQGLRGLQIGAVLNWIALPQFVLVPLVALCLKRIDARLLLVLGFAVIAFGSWLDSGLTHDWNGADFLPSQVIEAVGLALAITALVTYAVANITPPQAAAIAATIQIARLMGAEIGGALIQTFVRKREQLYSNLLGLHVQVGTAKTVTASTLFEAPFDAHAVGSGDPVAQALATMAALVRREAYVLAYIDSFWLIAWVLTAGLLLVLLLRPPPPNPLTPPRLKT